MQLTLDKSVHLLTVILAIVMISVVLLTANQLYSAAFNEEKGRLMESVKSQARLIEAMARYNIANVPDAPVSVAEESTLAVVREAHGQYQGFGETSEFTLGKAVDGKIVFLLHHRNAPMEGVPLPSGNIEIGSQLAIPMQLALAGKSGTVIGSDYRGAEVVAAYEPVSILNYGIVAKIDLAEIQRPFLIAIGISLLLGVVLIVLGSFAFRKITKPLLDEIHAQKDKFQMLLDSTDEGIFGLDLDGNFIFANPACINLLGYESSSELLGQNMYRLIHHHHKDGSEYSVDECKISFSAQGGEGVSCDSDVFWTRDGKVIPVEYHAAPIIENGVCSGTVVSFNDITERRKAQESQQLAATVYNNILEGIIVTDEDARIISINDAFTHLTGYSEEDAIGELPTILSSGRHDKEFFKIMWKALETDGYWQGEVWNRHKSGGIFPVWEAISAVKNEDDEVIHYVSAFSNITPLKDAEAHLEYLAHHDPLTQLPNRLLYKARFELSLEQAIRNKLMMAMLFIDLDGFKQVNDIHGHEIGDELLKQVADRLLGITRKEDTVGRWGGDEFSILYIGMQDSSHVETLAQNIVREISRSFIVDTIELNISCSVGISLYPEHGVDMETLIRRADEAMYDAKQAGKNRYVFSSDDDLLVYPATGSTRV